MTSFQMNLIELTQSLQVDEAVRQIFRLCDQAEIAESSFRSGLRSSPGLTAQDLAAAAFFCRWNAYSVAGVPYEEWEDVARAAIEFLKRFIESGETDFEKFPGFQEFWKLRSERMNQFAKDPRFKDIYSDLQGY